jgi:hypothetical protein
MYNKIKSLATFIVAVLSTFHSYSQNNNNEQRNAGSQEFKIAFSKPSQPGKIKIYALNDIEVQSYSGKEVILTASGVKAVPQRAEGLRPVYNSMVDNTNMGLSIKEVDNTIEVNSLTRRGSLKYKIMVPANASIQIMSTDHEGPRINVTNFTNEIDIQCRFGNIELEDITGPAIVHNVHGKINVKFSKVNPKNPISITSVHGDVDVTLPTKTPANLEMKSSHGEIYTDMDIAFNNTNKDNMRQISGNQILGKLNGGGVEIHLESTHSNIYLRKANQ